MLHFISSAVLHAPPTDFEPPIDETEPPPNGPRRGRTAILATCKVAISVGLLAVLFSRIDLIRLWGHVKSASITWLMGALSLYFLMILLSAWRWRLLLAAQHVRMPLSSLVSSYLVATFFNNFLPSNIGGDVVRIRDTARLARSKTLATLVVFVDRGIGLIGLVLVAALGATVAARMTDAATPVWPIWLWACLLLAAAVSVPMVLAPAGFGRLLRPLTIFHPEWVGARIASVIETLERFRQQPSALLGAFVGAICVQSVLVAFYVAVAHSMDIPIPFWHLAVIVPVSFVVQMLPVSVNGFGVREATFSLYFTRLGLPLESALVVSLVATGLVMFFSLSGAAVYVSRTASA